MPSFRGSSTFKAIKGITIYGVTGPTGAQGRRGADLYGNTGPTADYYITNVSLSDYTLVNYFENGITVGATGSLKGITGNSIALIGGIAGTTGSGAFFVGSVDYSSLRIRKLKGVTVNRSFVGITQDPFSVTISVDRYDGGFTLVSGSLTDLVATDDSGNLVGVTLSSAKYGSQSKTLQINKANVYEKTRGIEPNFSGGSINYLIINDKITVFLHPEISSNNSVDRNAKPKLYSIDLRGYEDAKFVLDNPSSSSPTSFSLYVTSNLVADSYQYAFSDDYSKLVSYSEKNNQKKLKIYSVNFSASPNVFTQIKEFSANTFDIEDENKKIFISNDGKYIIVSCPSNKQVKFIDADSESVLQTIQENYPNFGSKIAVDQDFYGMAISTYDLTRNPDQYDTRITSFGISSPICYYRRNYGSTGAQFFKKIHEHNAHTDSRSNGLATLKAGELKINNNNASVSPPASSMLDSCGINRCDDIKCKGYNFSLVNVSKEIDQILYNSHFPNVSNSKFNILRPGAGFTYENINYYLSVFYKLIGATGATFSAGPNGIRTYSPFTDEFLKSTTLSNYFMEGNFGLKNFSIVRNVNNKLIVDGSYRTNSVLKIISQPCLNNGPRNYYSPNATGYSDGDQPYFSNTFMDKMTFKTPTSVLPISIEGSSSRYTGKYKDAPERNNFFREETNNTKIAINTNNEVYIISKYITNSFTDLSESSSGSGYTAATENLNIPNIRIYRLPSITESETESFQYFDSLYDSTSSSYRITPEPINYGLIKLMHKTEDRATLETILSDSIVVSGESLRPSSYVFLQDPSSCPNSQFSQIFSSEIMTQTIQNCFVSNSYLFVCFDTNTVIFKINTLVPYRPLLLDTILSFSMKNYTHAYTSTEDYFVNNDDSILYKYNRTTKLLDQINNIT